VSGKSEQLVRAVEAILTAFAPMPNTGLGAYLRVEAGLIALVALEDICGKPDDDPYPSLLSAFIDIERLPASFANSMSHMRSGFDAKAARPDGMERTADLFEAAWTHYDDETFEHSVGLVESRLARSGFDRDYFAGKTCFDGGCGTGRLSIAMARAGAKAVVAADIGGESLEYLKKTADRRRLTNIKIVAQDVTNLGEFPSDSFDFVASNGVLHHTAAPDRGIVEHFRVTRPGGIFWIYLYGANGFYWSVYDKLKVLVRDLEPRTIREILTRMNIRRGLIYTYLDNMLAPRVYYRREQVLELLRPHATFSYVHAKGASPIDDTNKLLATRWGRDIFGPDGEIRIAVSKQSAHADAHER
jgi:ubiquinone/menaquinone biosynthesis C-methylase UbiE